MAEERLFQKDEEITSAQQKSTVQRLYTVSFKYVQLKKLFPFLGRSCFGRN